MNDISKIVDWCINSMKQEPEAWKVSDYEVMHRNGISVWIANGHYGMSVQTRDAKVGGVTAASSFFGPFIPWRRRLRRAALSLEGAGGVSEA